MLGESEPCEQDEWTYNVMERTRESAEVSNIAGLNTPQITLDTDKDAPGYFLVNDLVMVETVDNESPILLKVVDIGINGPIQSLVLEKPDGSNIVPTDIADGERVGHIANTHPEASSAPDGRLFLPLEERGKMITIRRTCIVSGSELTNRTYLSDGKSWYFTNQEITEREFQRDRELYFLMGTDATNGLYKQGAGLLNYAALEGVNNTFAGAVTEADLQFHITQLLKEGGSKEYLVLCGADFMQDAQNALKDYHLGGGVNYGMFKNNEIGLDVDTYAFQKKLVHFVYYQVFNDDAALPYQGVPTPTKPNFNNFSLWLDMGTDSHGKRLIRKKHKEHAGISRKFMVNYVRGITSPDGKTGEVSTLDDKFTIGYTSEEGFECRLRNRLGILRAIG